MNILMRLGLWFAQMRCRIWGHDLTRLQIVDPDDYLPTGEHFVICLRCGEVFA